MMMMFLVMFVLIILTFVYFGWLSLYYSTGMCAEERRDIVIVSLTILIISGFVLGLLLHSHLRFVAVLYFWPLVLYIFCKIPLFFQWLIQKMKGYLKSLV